MHQFDLTVNMYPPETDTATHAAIIAAVDLVAEVVAEVHPDPTRTTVDALVETPVRLTVRGWADDVDLPELLTVTRDALDAAVSSVPGLAGWWVLAVPTDALPADHPHRHPSHHRLTGPEADAAYRASVLAAADLFAAFPLDKLTYQDPPDPTELGRARALAGALMVAAAVVGDMLLEDARAVAAGDPVADTTYLAGLPPLLVGHYTPAFLARFHQVFLDLGERLARPWVATTCVAQDLGTRLLADGVEVVADLASLDLPDGWRALLDDVLLADTDIDYLYDPAMDGFSGDLAWREVTGMVSLRVEDWFTPYALYPDPGIEDP
jgi:hypothetical protein